MAKTAKPVRRRRKRMMRDLIRANVTLQDLEEMRDMCVAWREEREILSETDFGDGSVPSSKWAASDDEGFQILHHLGEILSPTRR